MPDMKKKYSEEVRSALAEKLGIKNVMQIPKIEKIVVSTGILRIACDPPRTTLCTHQEYPYRHPSSTPLSAHTYPPAAPVSADG